MNITDEQLYSLMADSARQLAECVNREGGDISKGLASLPVITQTLALVQAYSFETTGGGLDNIVSMPPAGAEAIAEALMRIGACSTSQMITDLLHMVYGSSPPVDATTRDKSYLDYLDKEQENYYSIINELNKSYVFNKGMRVEPVISLLKQWVESTAAE